jgi:hypothetical protein
VSALLRLGEAAKEGRRSLRGNAVRGPTLKPPQGDTVAVALAHPRAFYDRRADDAKVSDW